MKIHKASRCLAVATFMPFFALSVVATAQEEAQELDQGLDQQEQEQAPEPAQEPARQLFVDDKLVLNVYAEADPGSARVATIETGEAVGELERGEGFIRVRLDDGREGWVGSNYLTAEAPAVVRLRDQQRAQKSAVQAAEKKSAEEIARLQKQNAALEGEVKDLKAQAGAAAPAASVQESSPEDLAEPDESFEEESTSADVGEAGGVSWIWPVLVLVAGGSGFFLGYQMLARRIRDKFGGLKVY